MIKKKRKITRSNEYAMSPKCSLRRTVLFLTPNLCGLITIFDTNSIIPWSSSPHSRTLTTRDASSERFGYHRRVPLCHVVCIINIHRACTRCMSRKFFKTLHDPVVGYMVRERVRWRRTHLYCLRCDGGGVVLTIRQRRDLPLDIHCGGGGGGTCVTLYRHVAPYP